MEPQYRSPVATITGLATLVAALAVAAIVAPSGVAKPADLNGPAPAVAGSVVDLRSPDRQFPAAEPAPASTPAVRTDLRSPDRQFPAPAGTPAVRADLRSPDAADERSPGRSPAAPARVAQGGPALVSSDDALEWWSAAAGAGAMFTIALAGLTGWAAVARRRGAPGRTPTTVATGR